MSYWRWLWHKWSHLLSVRATLIALFGIAGAIIAATIESYIPWDFPTEIGADAVGSILNIIASSMLAVTTFSLSIMTAAFGSASSNATPRAAKLLMEDTLTHSVLSTFIGSFLFSIVGIIVLSTGSYGERGRFILFLFTIVVLVLIVVALLRWINHLTQLGRLSSTTTAVENVAIEALQERLKAPYLGGHAFTDELVVPAQCKELRLDSIGYIQFIDVERLAKITGERELYLHVLPGAFIYPHEVVASLSGEWSDEELLTLSKAFIVGNERSFEQDPRFSLMVLGEIGSRALSTAINDSGTVIDVLGRLTRVLLHWSDADKRDQIEPLYPQLFIKPLSVDDLFEDAFMLLARDGAGLIEVQLKLAKSLVILGQCGNLSFREAAKAQAALALARAESVLSLEVDKQRVRAIYKDLMNS